MLFNKCIEISLVALQFQVCDLKNVCATITQETRVVRHHDTSDIGQRVDVVLNPSNIDNIQVIGRFIQQLQH